MKNHQNETEIKVTCPDCHNNLDLRPGGMRLTRYLGGGAVYSFICTYPGEYCGEVAKPADKIVDLLLSKAGVRVIEIARPDELDDAARNSQHGITDSEIADFRIDLGRLPASEMYRELGHSSVN